MTGESRWSWRFSPTPGRSATTSMPCVADVGGPDAREQEQLRRPDRPAADDDLCCARSTRRRDHSTPTQRARRTGAAARVAPVTTSRSGVAFDRSDVGRGGAVADAVLDAVLHERHPVLRGAVVVVVERDAALLRRLDDRDVDRVGPNAVSRLNDATVAGRPPFDALVDRTDVLPRPAVGAEVRPRVEVRGCAADPDHRVRQLDPPSTLPARPGEPPSVGVALRHGLVRPVDLGEPELVQAPRIVDRRVLVATTGLEQQRRAAPASTAAGRRLSPADRRRRRSRRRAVTVRLHDAPCVSRAPPSAVISTSALRYSR